MLPQVDRILPDETPSKTSPTFPFQSSILFSEQFSKFVASTYYETEAEKYGWSFSFVSPALLAEEEIELNPEAENWVVVPGACWRQPEGPHSSYKYREQHPVVYVSHKDAAEYCTWVGKRLPGEFEYEAAARSAPHYSGPANRTLYVWGEEQSVDVAKKYANLWGADKFPFENLARGGWRGFSPKCGEGSTRLALCEVPVMLILWMEVSITPQHWEPELPCTGPQPLVVGFRCAKSPKKRTAYHWTWHDESAGNRTWNGKKQRRECTYTTLHHNQIRSNISDKKRSRRMHNRTSQ